jgi:DNA-binding SARP family transcriptional activator
MEFRVLGPLEVLSGDRALELGGRRQRALLSCLLIRANEVVPSERLLEELWGGVGVNALQVSVSRLRRALDGEERLLTRPPGYVLRVSSEEYDRDEFVRLAGEGRRLLGQGRVEEAAATLSRALALWRGAPLADFLYEPFAQTEIARLEEARLACLEDRVEADLARGRHAELVGELDALTREHPLRERLRGQLMCALYRSDRQAEALSVYQSARQMLVEELGIEPSDSLRDLHQAILRQDPGLHLPRPETADTTEPTEVQAPSQSAPEPVEPRDSGATPPPRAATPVRKMVTVLVAGIAGRIDPEVRHRLGERAWELVSPALERHGAAVERLLGGRVIGVFGVPAAHEDDALRAVRAAAELRGRFVAGGEPFSIGIGTGETLTGDRSMGEPLITGDALELAVQLQQAGEPGTVCLGEATRRLVADAVTAEPVTLPAGVGVAGAGPAWQLLELVPDAPAFQRRFDAPFVGRAAELAQLRQVLERATRERRAHLVTVFGEAGIGKTRLVQELSRSAGDEARVLTGRCLSYGEGITYWPVREILTQACGGRGLRELLGDDPDREAIAERLDSAVGTGTAGAVGEEVFWAFRRLVESQAHDLPVVLVFEDIHWGEPTLLDLIEHLADWVRDAPLLIVCLARPELLDERPGWGGGKLNATSLLLEPLSEEESSLLVAALAAGTELGPEASRRITRTSEGNPLFLEQMLAMVSERGGTGEIVVPPAIQALLAARLDHLTQDERRVIERASLEGEQFHTDAVVELSSPEVEEHVTAQLASLVRKDLIRPDAPSLPGERAFRFRHALIRDAAYAGLPKQARSDLHERYASWLERVLGERVAEGEEFLAYHLEQAHRYRVELDIDDGATHALRARAGELLASAGRRAFGRGDWPATVNLWERALALLPEEGELRRGLLPDLALALFQSGSMERADALAVEAVAAAEAAGDRASWARAAVTRTYMGTWLRPEQLDVEGMRRESEQAFAIFDELDDDAGRSRAIFNIDVADWASGDCEALARSAERAIGYARRAGIRPDELECSAGLGWAMCFGATPPAAARLRIQEVVGADRDRSLAALAATLLALLDGMEGRLDEARARMDEGRQALAEVGGHHWVGLTGLLDAELAVLAADHTLAERVLREALELPVAAANRMLAAWLAAELARVLHFEGRDRDAFSVTETIEQLPQPIDLFSRTRGRGARALALAGLGRLDEAEALARDAVELAGRTDLLNTRGDTLVDLAEILRLAERPAEAAKALEEAVGLFERKENVVAAANARAALAELT